MIINLICVKVVNWGISWGNSIAVSAFFILFRVTDVFIMAGKVSGSGFEECG